ncbi:MAG TPA: DHA2 family efflux MFS transporter permease subunit [Ktedonobacterales bacterium]
MRLEYKWRATIVVVIGLFMAILDNTIVNVALPQMLDAFHTDRATIDWVVTGYFLSQAAVIPVTGYLSDRIGTKAVFLTALAIFTVGSALCAFAPSEGFLIGWRVLQGVGGGALFPMAFAIAYRVFPPDERGPASAVIGVPILLAPAFGPTIGGYLTTTFDWSAIFTVNVPIGIVALILGIVILRGRAAEQGSQEGGAPAPGRFDMLGLVLAMVGFTALVYGITEAGAHGWNDTIFDRFNVGGLVIEASVVRYLILGGVVLVVFTVNELLVKDPVMDMRLFLNYTFTMSNLLLWAISAFLFGSLILLPYFFENVRGETALSTGEIFISQGLAAAVTTAIAGRLYNRVGPRILAAAGFVLLSIGTYGFTQLSVNTTGASVQGWLVVRGLGLGLTNIPLQTLVLSVVSNRAMARASSLVSVTRQVFGAVGIAALNTYLTQQVSNHTSAVADTFKSLFLPSAQAACAAKYAPNVGQITQCVQQAARGYVIPHAFVMGLNDTFVLVTIATASCVVVALLVGRDPAVQAAKQAKARGETVAAPRPGMTGE